MPQLHLYVSEGLADSIRQRADARRMTVSRYLAEVIKREVGVGWPEGFFEEVIGGWQGKPLRRPPQGHFDIRDVL